MEKTVFTFGRLNPPTVGHEKLVNKVKQVAKRLNAEPHVFLSHSQNSKKDPLNYNQKFKYAKQAFGNLVTKSNARTVIQIMQELEKMNHKDVVMIVGSDRVQEFRALLNKYNGKDYNFNSINVISAGERDPDAEGVSGMSASKMRAAVSAGDQASFMKGVPSKLSRQSAARMYSDLRSAMNITEDFNDFDWELWAETVDIDDEEILDEAVLSFAQRIKRARTMKRLAPRMKNLRRIKKFRMADKDLLMKRARKQAIRMFRKKVAGDKGEHYDQLAPAAKINIDKLIQKKLPAVSKLAQRLLPKVRKAEVERLRSARKQRNEATEVPQDQDIKDRKGTQPKKYFKDLSKSTKTARDAHFKKYAKRDDSNPDNYKPAPGDSKGKTKPSVHTTKFKQMFGEKLQKDTVIGGKSYKHMELCADAVKAFKRDIADDSLDRDKVETALRAVDKYLGVERRALNNKNATDADVEEFKKLQAIAKEKIKDAGLKGHTYHDLHLRTIMTLNKKVNEDYNTPAADNVDGNKTYPRFAALTDLDLNTYNRNLTVDEYSYGPANPGNEKDSQAFWEKKADLWNTSVDQVKTMRCGNCSAFNQSAEVKKMMSDALGPKGKDIIEMADLGYCEFFEFKCAGARTCDAWVGGGPITESNGQTDDVADIVPDRIRISMISGSKKRLLNDKFEKMLEQDSADRTRDRHAAEKERLRTQHKREREQQKAAHDRQLDRSKIRDIRSESLDEAFEAMQRKQQKGSSSVVPRDNYMLDEKQIDALKKKSEKTGIPYGILKKVYNRGMAAWKSGHRPGTTPQQWAFARVNSFATKSKGTWGGADKDLAQQVRGKKESVRVGPYMGKADVTEQKDTRCPRTKAEQCHCDKLNEINEADASVKAVCELIHSDKVKGIITLTQSPGQSTKITGQITGLTPGKHGFHIHEFGDLSDGCKSAGGHYNPEGVDHGDLSKGHVGDLGNVVANGSGVANINITANRVSLLGEQSVIGRAIVIHADEDDLGKGGDEESLKTGNAGDRLACGVISLSEVQSESLSLDESFQMLVQQPAGYGQVVTAKEAGIDIQAGFALHPSVSEEGGAGEFGTDKLVKKYKQETPGEDLKEQSWIQFESCCEDCMEELMITEAEYQGKKVKLNDPIRTSENPKKKFKVYVRDPSSGNIKVVRFGDPGLSIKRDDPGRRRNFRARHNCDNPGPITKARYWSCRMWSKRTVSSLD